MSAIVEVGCRVTLGAAALGIAAAAAAQDQAPTGATPDGGFFIWTDTSATLLPNGSGFEVDPSQQSTLTLEHAHASSSGDLFMFVDFTRLRDTEGGDDSTWHGEIGPRLSLGKVFHAELSGALTMFLVSGLLIARPGQLVERLTEDAAAASEVAQRAMVPLEFALLVALALSLLIRESHPRRVLA